MSAWMLSYIEIQIHDDASYPFTAQQDGMSLSGYSSIDGRSVMLKPKLPKAPIDRRSDRLKVQYTRHNRPKFLERTYSGFPNSNPNPNLNRMKLIHGPSAWKFTREKLWLF